MTLVEVMIAMGILSVILYITFQVLMSSQSAYNDASISHNLESRGHTFLDHYKKELLFCRIQSLATDGSTIRYQVQIAQYDLSGNLLNTAQEYGYYYNGNQTNYAGELAFVPTRYYRESSAAPQPPLSGTPVEVLDGIDMNTDGDITDTFAQGRIEQNVYDAGGILIDVSRAADLVILGCTSGTMGDDIDNDGILDPLFTVLDSSGNSVLPSQIALSGVKLRLNLWHGDFDENRTRFILRNLRDEWNFRNDQ